MKRNCRQEDEALEKPVVMQRRGDETERCLRLDHPGQNEEERPKHDENVIR